MKKPQTKKRLQRILILPAMLACCMLVFGASTFGREATAETYDVSAQNLAPVPTVQATFSSPQDGSVVENDSLTITGTCEQMDPRIIVVIERAGEPVGSVLCSTDGTYSLVVQLISGVNVLIARSLTITDEYGPDSIALSVTYNAPVPPPPPPTPTPTPTPTAPSPAPNPTTPSPTPTPNPTGSGEVAGIELYIKAQPIAVQYTTGTRFQLEVEFGGGNAPYELRIDWGDGDVDVFGSSKSGSQTLYHTYQTVADKSIRASVTDKSGTNRHTSVAAVGRLVANGSLTPDFVSAAGSTILGVRPRDAAILGAATVTVLTILLQGTIPLPSFLSFGEGKTTTIAKRRPRR